MFKKFLKKGFIINCATFAVNYKEFKEQAIIEGYVPGTPRYYAVMAIVFLLSLLIWPVMLVVTLMKLLTKRTY